MLIIMTPGGGGHGKPQSQYEKEQEDKRTRGALPVKIKPAVSAWVDLKQSGSVLQYQLAQEQA